MTEIRPGQLYRSALEPSWAGTVRDLVLIVDQLDSGDWSCFVSTFGLDADIAEQGRFETFSYGELAQYGICTLVSDVP